MQTTTVIPIHGMTCMGCVNSVKTVLGRLPGITLVEVTLDPAQAVIQHDSVETDINQLRQAIIDAGFEIT